MELPSQIEKIISSPGAENRQEELRKAYGIEIVDEEILPPQIIFQADVSIQTCTTAPWKKYNIKRQKEMVDEIHCKGIEKTRQNF